MSYRVFWAPLAEERLARIATAAKNRDLIAATARKLDNTLIASPNTFGESRDEDLRVGFEEPLVVLFEVMEDVRTVIVHDVWRPARW